MKGHLMLFMSWVSDFVEWAEWSGVGTWAIATVKTCVFVAMGAKDFDNDKMNNTEKKTYNTYDTCHNCLFPNPMQAASGSF